VSEEIEKLFWKNYGNLEKAIKKLEYAVINQKQAVRVILNFSRLNIPILDRQVKAGKIRLKDRSRIIRRQLPKFIRNLIKLQKYSSEKADKLSEALNTFASKIPREYRANISELRKQLKKFNDFFKAEMSFENNSFKKLLEVKKHIHEVDTDLFQRTFYVYVENNIKKLTFTEYLAFLENMLKDFNSKKDTIVSNLLRDYLFSFEIDIREEDVTLAVEKRVIYVYDTSFLADVDFLREYEKKNVTHLIFPLEGEKILLKSVQTEASRLGGDDKTNLVDKNSLNRIEKKSTVVGVRPTQDEKDLFLNLLEFKTHEHAKDEEEQIKDFVRGADIRILSFVKRQVAKGNFVVVLTSDSDIIKIINKLKIMRDVGQLWRKSICVYGISGIELVKKA
tara:strand:+ start:756 stop:1931 length:1176 start_codon:yes stop_codon:yes gene_type:complete